MQIKEFLADALCNAIASEVNDSGTAVLRIYSAAFGAILATYNLPATPFSAATAGVAGYRQINVSSLPIAGTGLAAAGAGTAAAKYRLLSEAGDVIGEGDVGGTGSGQECILSNVNIAENQEVNLVSFGIRFAAPLGA